VAVEEETTNLIPSRSASVEEDASTGWNNSGAIHERTTDDAWHGQASIRATNPRESGSSWLTHGVSISNPPVGTLYTVSAYVKGVPGTSVSIGISFTGGPAPTSWQYAPVTAMNGQWQRVTVTHAVDQPDRTGVTVSLALSTAGATYYWDAIQLEQKPFPTSFVDGRRASGRLSYPITLGRKGTISFWWNKSKRTPSGFEMPFRLANNVFEANIQDVSARVNHVTASVSWNPGEWHHFAYAWDMDASGTKQWLFIDGQLEATSTSVPPDPTAYSTLYVGWGGDSHWFNGLIDELLILPYAASEEEIVSWYEAQGPLPPHPQALLQWDRQAVRPAQMVKL